MDLQDNYIVTSDGGTPSSFVSNFAYPIRVQRGHKMALKSIHYGPKYNVTDDNNKLFVKVDQAVPVTIEIENGWYPDVYFLFLAIAKAVDTWVDDFNSIHNTLDHCKVEYSVNNASVELIFDKVIFVVHDTARIDVLDLLELQHGLWNKLEANNAYFSSCYSAFLYANVIENSYINNIPSRLLAIIPMRSGYSDGTTGYHFHEFNSPTYYNFGIREFSNVLFELRDVKGQLIDIHHDFNTTLVLEVFKPLDVGL